MNRIPLFTTLLVLIALLSLVNQVLAQEPDLPPTGHKNPTPTPTSVPIKPFIVGGALASPGEYPWQVALVQASASNPRSGQFCGGSLIDPKWVLTAAHCVVDSGLMSKPADIDIVLGINKLSTGPTSGISGQRIDVAQVIPYLSFNESTFDSDLALLRLTTPATLMPTVSTIGLIGPSDSALVTPSTVVTVTGWGNRLGQPVPGGTSFPDDLYEVGVPIVSNATCNGPTSYNGQITNNMLCAGLASGGKDSCQGDSGGPLIASNGSGGWLQAGIVSWGEGCAQPNLYGVYTQVSQFKNWINLQINGPGITPHAVYLPVVIKLPSCTVATPGESSNVANAPTVCSGQTITGQVNAATDFDDVFKISVSYGQQLTLSMTGTGGNADLYLYRPGTTNVITDPPSASSHNSSNTESLQVTIFASGFWYIDVYSPSGTTNYNLTATVSNP